MLLEGIGSIVGIIVFLAIMGKIMNYVYNGFFMKSEKLNLKNDGAVALFIRGGIFFTIIGLIGSIYYLISALINKSNYALDVTYMSGYVFVILIAIGLIFSLCLHRLNESKKKSN